MTFTDMRRPVAAILLATALVGCRWGEDRTSSRVGAGLPERPPPEKPSLGTSLPKHPDLLIVTFDTTRADHLGAWGYPRATSPHLDALCAEGVRAARFVVPQATTLPTHLSLFSGLLPDEHGVVANSTFSGERFVPPPSVRMIAPWLAAGGYRTAGFVSSTPLKKSSGVHEGFETWSEPVRSSRLAADTTEAALGWLRAQKDDTPLLLWVHYYDPHGPYQPIPELRGHFSRRDEIAEHVKARRYAPGSKERERVAGLLANYDAEIYYTDRQLGRLLAAWDEQRRDRSVVVVAGDHGEGLLQHGHLDHGLVWDEQLHAPFVLRAPGVSPRVIEPTVQAIDLLPTLLALADLPDEPAVAAQLTGTDVLAPGFGPRPTVVRSSARQTHLGEALTYALTEPPYKLHAEPDGTRRLYDLSADPHELHDLAKTQPERAAAMDAALREAVKALKERGKALGAGKTEKLDEATVQQLKDIGYME